LHDSGCSRGDTIRLLYTKRKTGGAMKAFTGITTLLLGAAIMIAAPGVSWSADPDAQLQKSAMVVNAAANTPAGQQKVADRLAHELNASCHCTTYSAASLRAQRAQTGWGWGELAIANRLAQAISTKTGVSLAAATAQVTAERQQHTGWGAIAKAHDLKVGALVSNVDQVAKSVEKASKAADKPGEKTAKDAEKGADRGAKDTGKADAGKGDKDKGADVAADHSGGFGSRDSGGGSAGRGDGFGGGAGGGGGHGGAGGGGKGK
jgi:uncharacterized membrane protein YgcG